MSIVFVIGPACAGKSTYIKNNLPGYTVIDLWEYQKDIKSFTVSACWESYYACRDALIEAVKKDENVVLEHTLLRAERRKMYLDALKEVGFERVDVVLINPKKETLVQRKNKRGFNIDINSDITDLELLEIPTKEEGFQSVTIIEE